VGNTTNNAAKESKMDTYDANTALSAMEMMSDGWSMDEALRLAEEWAAQPVGTTAEVLADAAVVIERVSRKLGL
jgi:hypothetical protein